jgi:DNA-binding protein HU-beta
MNKSELVAAVAAQVGSDPNQARRHVDAVFDTFMSSVGDGERVVVTGFGTFDRVTRAARTVRNPRTGRPIEVPSGQAPRFSVGRTFKENVSGTAAPARAGRAAPAAARAAVADRISAEMPTEVATKVPTERATESAANGKKKKKHKDADVSAAASGAKKAKAAKAGGAKSAKSAKPAKSAKSAKKSARKGK